MTDAQLRRLIGEASRILEERRTPRGDVGGEQKPRLPAPSGEFFYDVKTSYFPHIKGHRPRIVRLEPHENGFVPVELNAAVRGHKRPMVMGRFAAKNGEVFKVVRENGERSVCTISTRSACCHDVAKTSELQRDSKQARVDFLKVEIETALTFARMAREAGSDIQKKQRNQANARKAYDTILDWRRRLSKRGGESRAGPRPRNRAVACCSARARRVPVNCRCLASQY